MKKGPTLVLLIKRVPFPYPLTVTFFGISLLLLESVIARYINISPLDLFSQIPLIPVAIMVVPYVLGVFCWAWEAYEPMLKEIGETFVIGKSKFQSIVEDYLQEDVYNDRKWLVACLAVGVPFIVLSNLIFLATEWVQWPFLRLMISSPINSANIVLLETMLAFLLSIGAYLVVIHSRFVRKVSNLQIRLKIFEPERSSKLESIAGFSLKGAFSYFLGMGLATVLTVGPSPFYIAIESLLFMFGLILFFVPQYALHKSIKKSKTEMLNAISRNFQEEYQEQETKDPLKILIYCNLFNEVGKLREWPFSLATLNQLIVSSFIPIATLIAKILRLLP